MDKEIVVSIKTVLFTVALFVVLFIVVKLGPILALLLIAALFVLALEPSVQFLMRQTLFDRPIPRAIAVPVAFTLAVIVILLVLTVGLPPVITQAQRLIANLLSASGRIPGLETTSIAKVFELVSTVAPNFSELSGNVVAVTVSFFSNILTVVSVLIIALYMSMDWENIKHRFFNALPVDAQPEVKNVLAEIEVSVGHWFRGQITLMVIVGFASFIGLLVLGIDYPLALGLISGLLEIVPMLGPLVSAVLAAVVGFSISPLKGLAAVALFILIQQVENNILVPKVMQKVSGFSPLVILLALLVGSNFFGVVGAIVAVPVTMILFIVIKHLIAHSYK